MTLFMVDPLVFPRKKEFKAYLEDWESPTLKDACQQKKVLDKYGGMKCIDYEEYPHKGYVIDKNRIKFDKSTGYSVSLVANDGSKEGNDRIYHTIDQELIKMICLVSDEDYLKQDEHELEVTPKDCIKDMGGILLLDDIKAVLF